MNKIAFAKMADDAYSECKTKEEITSMMEWMLNCIKIQSQLSIGNLKNGAFTHLDVCRTAADLAYMEHMKRSNNEPEKLIDCPYNNPWKSMKKAENQN